MPLIDLANPADLDTALFTSWVSFAGAPAWALDRRGQFVPTPDGQFYDAGPGAFVAPAILERGYNAYYGAPGYYVDARGVERVPHDYYVDDMRPPVIGVNPWDHVFGTYGAGDPVHYMQRVQARTRPVQAGVYSFG